MKGEARSGKCQVQVPKGLASPGHEPTFAGFMIGLMIFHGLEKSLSFDRHASVCFDY